MEIFHKVPRIDFVGMRYISLGLSVVLVAIACWGWIQAGDAKYGLDFSGGTDVVVGFTNPADIGQVRAALQKEKVEGATVQEFKGSGPAAAQKQSRQFSIRVASESPQKMRGQILSALQSIRDNSASILSEDYSSAAEVLVSFDKAVSVEQIRNALTAANLQESNVSEPTPGQFMLRIPFAGKSDVGKKVMDAMRTLEGNTPTLMKEEYVGPVIGEQIRKDGTLAFILSLVGILAYVTIRFEFRFALGAVVALAHDAVIAAGFYVLNGYEVSGALLAAVLTIIGFSVNDTVIVYDRIREEMARAYKGDAGRKTKEGKSAPSLGQIMNEAINKTLSRTILTSMTVFFTSLMLWRLGGGALAEFGYAFSIGCLVGTYSSVAIACPFVLLFEKPRKPSPA